MASAAKSAAGPQTGPGPTGQPVIDPTANVLALVEAAVKRLDDLRAAEVTRINDVMELRSYYDKKLNDAEAKRIDAIRAVDVAAVATASGEARAQANVLAGQVAATAETLRALVTATAAATDARIALLEKSQYQISGRGTGMSLSLSLLVSGVSLVLAIVGIVAFFNAAT
jgi:hypothetical protein